MTFIYHTRRGFDSPGDLHPEKRKDTMTEPKNEPDKEEIKPGDVVWHLRYVLSKGPIKVIIRKVDKYGWYYFDGNYGNFETGKRHNFVTNDDELVVETIKAAHKKCVSLEKQLAKYREIRGDPAAYLKKKGVEL